MEQKYNMDTDSQFPYDLDESVWGEIRHVEMECPGVYYLGTTPAEGHRCGRELYAVTPEAVQIVISEEALKYGIPSGGLYLFEYEVEGNGYELIRYEIHRYRVKNNIPVDRGDGSLYCAAIYAAERYPEYFGGVLPPRHTPYGLTVRSKKVAEGLYFLETDRCQWVLAVSNPIWECDLSEAAQALGMFCDYDIQTGVHEAKYLFFEESSCALPIYELLEVKEYEGINNYISSRSVLETTLYLNHLDYVIQHNMLEMAGYGKSDLLTNLLALFGAEFPDEEESEEQQAKRIANCIHLVPEAGNQRLLTLP